MPFILEDVIKQRKKKICLYMKLIKILLNKNNSRIIWHNKLNTIIIIWINIDICTIYNKSNFKIKWNIKTYLLFNWKAYLVANICSLASLMWTISKDPGCLSRLVTIPTRPKLRPPVIMHKFPIIQNINSVLNNT